MVAYSKHTQIKTSNINVSDDHSRVELDPEEGDIHSDYINADYITGYKDREKAFVAAQGSNP